MLSSSMSRIPTFFVPSLFAGSNLGYPHSVPFNILPSHLTSNIGTPARMRSDFWNVDPRLHYGMNYIPMSTIEPSNLGLSHGYGKWNNIRFNHGNTDKKSWNGRYDLSSGDIEYEENSRMNKRRYETDEYNGRDKRGLRRYPWNNGYDMGLYSTGATSPFHFQPLTLSTEPIDDTVESDIDIDRLSGDKIKLKKWVDSWKSEDVSKHKISTMSREEASMILLFAKKEQGLTFCDIAKKLGHSEFWTASAILGQQQFNEEEVKTIFQLLKMEKMFDKKVMEKMSELLCDVPMRGSRHRIPVDPTVYRLYEIFQVYGTTFKALLNEKFGDGVMSAVDVKLNLDKKTGTDGNQHVLFTIDGTFMPYPKW